MAPTAADCKAVAAKAEVLLLLLLVVVMAAAAAVRSGCKGVSKAEARRGAGCWCRGWRGSCWTGPAGCGR